MEHLTRHTGSYAIGAAAYLAACILSSTGYVVLERGRADGEMIGAVSAAMALIALIPFLLIKGALGVFQWDGVIAHLAGGAIAGVLGCSFLLSHGEAAQPALFAFFAAWGALSGLVYWIIRWIGNSMVMGRSA